MYFIFDRSLIPSYIRDSTVAVVVYDITSKDRYLWYMGLLESVYFLDIIRF